jgi:hypothetical protein
MSGSMHLGPAITRRAALAAGLAVLGTGCATTTLMSSWREPKFSGPPLKKLMVMAITRQATPRRVFEDTFAASLIQEGVQAVASYTYLPQDGPPERELVVKAVHDAGVDGVIVTRLLGRERQVRRDSQLEMVPMRSLHTGLGQAWVTVYEPREIEIIRVIAETSIYRASDAALLWTGITDSADPTNWQTATKSFARETLASMKKEGIL